jgi:hypothetical protein
MNPYEPPRTNERKLPDSQPQDSQPKPFPLWIRVLFLIPLVFASVWLLSLIAYLLQT